MPPKKKAVNSESKTVKKSSKKDLVMDEENTNITDTFKRVKKATGKGGTLKKKIRKDINDIDVQSIQAILKSFDLNCDYGPIIGILRTDRLIRAEYFNLAVSEDVKRILKDRKLLEEFPELNLNIWHDFEKIL